VHSKTGHKVSLARKHSRNKGNVNSKVLPISKYDQSGNKALPVSRYNSLDRNVYSKAHHPEAMRTAVVSNPEAMEGPPGMIEVNFIAFLRQMIFK